MENGIKELSQHQIAMFFERNAPVTQEQCNDKARTRTGHFVIPTTCQGGTSYTVAAGQEVVQFRVPGSILDMNFIKTIEQAYWGFTPQHNDFGTLGQLHIYKMNNIEVTKQQLQTPAKYYKRLRKLRAGLAERFHAQLDALIPQLRSLFAQDWPLVPNHTDLLENNIHVDPDTGAIVGICDWRDADVSPFGMSLGGPRDHAWVPDDG
ncbi:MAG: hypothetical protein Q9196_001094 [Gyalolechia fulgens]